MKNEMGQQDDCLIPNCGYVASSRRFLRIMIVLSIIAMITFLSSLIVSSDAACKAGCEYHDGVCACEAPVHKAKPVDLSSDEKPPKDKMPSYQREGIKADMPESLKAQDEKMIREINDASLQGKKAAGIE